MPDEEIRSWVRTVFTTEGLAEATQATLRYRDAQMELKQAIMDTLLEQDRQERGLTRRTPTGSMRYTELQGQAATTYQALLPQMRDQYYQQFGGLTGGGAGGGAFEQFEEGMRKVDLLSGAMSNLIHVYYWVENAQLQMENAQNRLLNAQDRYTDAVRRYGVGSQEAIRAYRSMEVAENRLERAHAREILNYALISTQVVRAIHRIGELTSSYWASVPAINAQTAAVQANNAAQAAGGAGGLRGALGGLAGAAMSPLGLFTIGLAAAGLFVYMQNMRQQEAELDINRRWAGITGHFGGEITSPGLIEVQTGERIIPTTATSGSQVSLNLGGISVSVSRDQMEGALDDAIDRQRFQVKSALRRFMI